MSNILYIGPYREFTGMGNAARQYIKALLVAGHNIGIRPIYNVFNAYPEKDIDYEILELESNIAKPYDILIQHCYPHQLYYDNRFQKNIGIIHLESSNYYSNINNYLSMMDEVIVGSNFVHKVLSSISFDKPIKVVPEPIDLEFIKKYRDNNVKSIKNNYSFYAIGDLSERKNLYEIVKAFVIAYDTDDNVDLVLKIISNHERVATDQEIEYELNKIYSRIKKNYEKRPRIVFGDIDYHSMLYLHNNNDCFINVSSGESFGYSTLEAMAFNNQIIVNDQIGSSEIIDEDCGLFNNVYTKSCEDSSRLYHIYNSYHQSWYKPEIDSLIVNMNTARNESKENREKRIEKQNDRLNNFSIESVSKILINI